MDLGSVSDGIYRNKMLGLNYKIPAGWVLRTEELNAGKESIPDHDASPQGAQGSTEVRESGGRVLLAAFSRPPDAKGEEVNSSILIAAEPVAAYPGLKEAVQYFEPLTEVAKAQGFTVDEEPYEFPVGARTLVRGDFHKDVGKLVMRQASLAMLAHGYAVSITLIGGTEDEVQELVDALNFGQSAPSSKK